MREGDFFALLGPNGAGKTTIIGIVTSLVRKSSGQIRIFGLDTDVHFRQAKARIGVVPQEINFSLFETCLEIVSNQGGYYGLPRQVARRNAMEHLEKLGMKDLQHTRSRTLSGGMKRRLMIARALVHQPKLLILDEPTAGVDVELRRSMWEFLSEINRSGTTIMLTTHYLEEAERLCRKIAIIDNGEIVENTEMRDLLKKLDTESFILDTRDRIKVPPEVPGYRIVRLDNHTLQVDVSKGSDLNRLFAALSEKNVQIDSMRNKSNRLEELFIHLTAEKQE